MPTPNTKATVTLSIVDQTQDRIKSMRADIEALAKASASSAGAATPAGRAQTAELVAQARAIKDAEQGWKGVAEHAGRAKSALSGLTSGFGGAAKGLGMGAIEGAGGLGGIGAVLGAGGIIAAVAAVGVIAGQSFKMAYEFEKAATNAAQALSIGTGPNLAGNVAALKSAATKGLAYNISSPDMMQAIATYGNASGQGVKQSAAAAGGIAMYSRAYGMEPAQVAAIIGQVTALSGKGFDSEAAGTFGAAENAGNLGRRLPEFLSAATSMLSSLQQRNALGDYSGSDAAGLLANVSRNQKGYYGTATGAASVFEAGKDLISGASDDPTKRAMLIKAGISVNDILLERGGVDNERKALKAYLLPNGTETQNIAQLRSVGGLGADPARDLLDRIYNHDGTLKVDPRTNHKFKSASDAVDYFYSDQHYGKDEAAKAKTKADQYKDTTLASYDKLVTDFAQKELEMGQSLLKIGGNMAKILDDLLNQTDDWLSGKSETEVKHPFAPGSHGGALWWHLTHPHKGDWKHPWDYEQDPDDPTDQNNPWTTPIGGPAGAAEEDPNGPHFTRGVGSAYAAAAAAAKPGAGFSKTQVADLEAASAVTGVPAAMLAAIVLKEHGGVVSNADSGLNTDGSYDRGYFQFNNKAFPGMTNAQTHDFKFASMAAAQHMKADWEKYHNIREIGELWNGGHAGAYTTRDSKGRPYSAELPGYVSQSEAGGIGSGVALPDGYGGTIVVYLTATAKHVPSKKPNTQSRTTNRK